MEFSLVLVKFIVCARFSDEQVAGHILKAPGRDFIGMHSALIWKGVG
jgi:hypothetical protein